MANNTAALRTELFNLLASTTNLDAATKTKLRDRFVAQYPKDWQAFLAGGGTDTAANRGQFVITKTFEYWQDIFRAGSVAENQAAVPPPEVIA